MSKKNTKVLWVNKNFEQRIYSLDEIEKKLDEYYNKKTLMPVAPLHYNLMIINYSNQEDKYLRILKIHGFKCTFY